MTKQMNLKLDEELIEEFEELAKTENLDRSSLIKKILIEGLQQRKIKYCYKEICIARNLNWKGFRNSKDLNSRTDCKILTIRNSIKFNFRRLSKVNLINNYKYLKKILNLKFKIVRRIKKWQVWCQQDWMKKKLKN